MKRTVLLSAVLILALLLCGCEQFTSAPAPTTAPTAIAAPTATAAPTPATPSPTPTPAPTEKPVSPEMQALREQNKEVWREMHNRPYMEGRLVIPSVGINVALFNEGENPQNKSTEVLRQEVVDLEDSALLYYDDPVGNIIADHSNQAFATLPNVKVGDTACILSGDRMVTLECVFAADGVNTGYGITDMDGGWHHTDADYVCYTCLEDWTHIQMVGFAMKEEDFFDMDWIDIGDAASSSGTAAVTTTSKSSNNGVATTISLPAPSVADNSAADTTADPAVSAAPAATPTPSPTPQPAQQTAAPRPAVREPVYEDYNISPEFDVYADHGSSFGIYYSSGIDGYLG